MFSIVIRKPDSNTIDASSLLEFKTTARNYKIHVHRTKLVIDRILEPFNYLVSHIERVMKFVNNRMKETPNVKLGITISVLLEKSVFGEFFFNSPTSRIACASTDDEYLEKVDALMTQLKVFATGGSSWVVQSSKRLEIRTFSCSNVAGAS